MTRCHGNLRAVSVGMCGTGGEVWISPRRGDSRWNGTAAINGTMQWEASAQVRKGASVPRRAGNF